MSALTAVVRRVQELLAQAEFHRVRGEIDTAAERIEVALEAAHGVDADALAAIQHEGEPA